MMKYDVVKSSKYKRDLKKVIKRGYDISLLDKLVDMLQEGLPLPPKHKDHALKGNWNGFRECHIAPDWLLIYRYEENVLILVLQRTGTHSDLF